MAGFTVNGSNRFLETGSMGDSKSLRIDQSSQGTSLGNVEGTKSFSETLNQAVQQVNQLQKTADKKAQDLATGRTDNVAEVMIASEKADIAMRLMVQVRNKIIDAYQEIMKMQV